MVWRIARAEIEAENDPTEPDPEHVDNPIDRFIADRCECDEHATATVADAHVAYSQWADAEREDAISAKRLTIELTKRGITTSRTKTARCYVGLRVTGFPLSSASRFTLGEQ